MAPSVVRLTSVLTLLVSTLIATGCASHLPSSSRTSGAADYRKLAVQVSQQHPQIQIDPRLTGDAGAVARERATEGAGGAIIRCLEVPYPPLLALCGVLGATVGGVVGHIEAKAAAHAKPAFDMLLRQTDNLGLSGMLQDQVRRYAAQNGIVLTDQAANEDALVVITLEAIHFETLGGKKLPGYVELAFRGQLIRNGQTIDEFRVKRQSRWQDIHRLQGAALQQLSDDITRQAVDAGQRFIDEFLLIYRPPDSAQYQQASRDKRWSPTTPPYSLRPVSPAASREQVMVLMAYPQQTLVESLTPRLAWEAFPRPWDLPDREPGRISQVSYDLRLYDDRQALIDEVTGLDAPAHTLSRQLQPCSRYFWSVRARFLMDGRPRVTEWSGVYNKIPLFPEYPWRMRRGELSTFQQFDKPAHFRLGFRTPAADPAHPCRP